MEIRGKVVVVTGATSGLGQAFAVDVAQKGARVFLVGRDERRAKETLAEIQRAGGSGEIVLGDVSTIAGARAVAAAVLERTPRVDVLVNNAGGSFKTATQTADGIETTFALNTVGAFVLEKELHAALVAAKGRVVNVATGLLDSFPVDVDDIVAPKRFKSLAQYGRSKQALVMTTVEQANRFAPEGVSAVALHPGVIMGTRFGGGQPKLVQAIIGPILRAIGFACSMEEATRRFTVAAFGDVPTGSYVVKGKPSELPKQVKDAAVREKVVRLLQSLTERPGDQAARVS